jgi:hypothetical protein
VEVECWRRSVVLRLLTGLPAADGNVIRPLDEPTMAEFLFSWELVTEEALQRLPGTAAAESGREEA